MSIGVLFLAQLSLVFSANSRTLYAPLSIKIEKPLKEWLFQNFAILLTAVVYSRAFSSKISSISLSVISFTLSKSIAEI